MDLSKLELEVLSACLSLHPNGYGVAIQDHIERRTGREPSTGSIYAVLDRLAQKGFVMSRQGEPTPERGGRRKLYYTVTAPGHQALSQSKKALTALWRGIRWDGVPA
jgi:PadR family transcriptional regulator PadR